MSSTSEVKANVSARMEEAPQSLPSSACACRVAKWALTFFVLSAVAAGVLCGLKLTSYLPIPLAIGGVAFVTFLIATCCSCVKTTQKPEPPKSLPPEALAAFNNPNKITLSFPKIKVTADSRPRCFASVDAVKRGHSSYLMVLWHPHAKTGEETSFIVGTEMRQEIQRSNGVELGWIYEAACTAAFEYLTAPDLEALKAHIKYRFEIRGSKEIDELLKTNDRMLFIERPPWLQEDPYGFFCDATIQGKHLVIERGLVAHWLMEFRDEKRRGTV